MRGCDCEERRPVYTLLDMHCTYICLFEPSPEPRCYSLEHAPFYSVTICNYNVYTLSMYLCIGASDVT